MLWSTISFSQLYIPKKPSFIPPIIDSTQTLSNTEISQLYEKLKNYSDSTSTEIFVMIVPTTQGEEIKRYATDLGHKWKIGQKGKDNGIVLLIAIEDRKIAIETGYGVEHLLTDALSRRIIEQEIKPQFKAKNYYQGIDNAANAIFKVMKGEYKVDKKNKEGGGSALFFIVILVIVFIIVFSNRNKGGGNGGGHFNAPSLLDVIILSSLGRSGGSGGGFGGSDSGGFGGFGGGGAAAAQSPLRRGVRARGGRRRRRRNPGRVPGPRLPIA